MILVNLVHNTPQVRWYVENLPLNEEIARADVEKKLHSCGATVRGSQSIIRAFDLLCQIPLGTELNFGTTVKEKNHIVAVKRTKPKVQNGLVVLYSLFQFAEAADGRYQFNLTSLTNRGELSAFSPTNIFGIDRIEMQSFLNGLSVNYPDFINATFTHDLEKISLAPDKSSGDVLGLFYL